ncbi:hypothetical protein C8F01DRAFT_1364841 [Mycena amicta]|nr:hypothetical protein C8F01DRAFT_1364841 [Mycena amicta]
MDIGVEPSSGIRNSWRAPAPDSPRSLTATNGNTGVATPRSASPLASSRLEAAAIDGNSTEFPPPNIVQRLQKTHERYQWDRLVLDTPSNMSLDVALERLESHVPEGYCMKLVLADMSSINIILFMPNVSHQAAAVGFTMMISQLLGEVIVASGTAGSLNLRGIGTGTYGNPVNARKQPDAGFTPEHAIGQTSPRWSSSSSAGYLHRVNLVVTVKLFPTTTTIAKCMEVTFYEHAPQLGAQLVAPYGQPIPGGGPFTWTELNLPSASINIPSGHIYDQPLPPWLQTPNITLSIFYLTDWVTSVLEVLE